MYNDQHALTLTKMREQVEKNNTSIQKAYTCYTESIAVSAITLLSGVVYIISWAMDAPTVFCFIPNLYIAYKQYILANKHLQDYQKTKDRWV